MKSALRTVLTRGYLATFRKSVGGSILLQEEELVLQLSNVLDQHSLLKACNLSLQDSS